MTILTPKPFAKGFTSSRCCLILTQSLIPPGGPLTRTLEGHSGAVYSVVVSPDGKHAVSGSVCGTLKIWDLSTGNVIRTLEGDMSVGAVAIFPDGKHVISGSWDDTLKIWDLSTGIEVTSFSGESQINAWSILPERNTIVGGSLSGKLHILQLEGK